MCDDEYTGKIEKKLLEDGVIYLSEEVDEVSSRRIIQSISYINRFKPQTIKTITLIINSPGGDSCDCFAVIDAIKASKIPVHTVGIGIIASAGLLIFMAGTPGERAITQYTSTLSHRFSEVNIGNYSELKADRVQQDILYERMVNFYKNYTNLKTKEDIESILLRDVDVWLTSEQAIKYGVADKLVKSEDLQL